MVRLLRGTPYSLDVFDVLHTGRLAPRIHHDALCAMDLTARTDAPLSTVQCTVQPCAATGGADAS